MIAQSELEVKKNDQRKLRNRPVKAILCNKKTLKQYYIQERSVTLFSVDLFYNPARVKSRTVRLNDMP